MRFAFTLLAASLAFASACKKSGAGEAITKLTELKDKVCACKDKACVDQVSADMAKWSSEHKSSDTEKLSAEEEQKMNAVSTEMIACISRVTREAAAAATKGAAAGVDSAAAAASAAAEGGAAAVAAGSAAAAGAGAAGAEGAGGAGAATAGAPSAAGAPDSMPHRAGMCPSTVLGATTKAAVKGTSVVVTIESTDKDAIAAIQRRTDELLAEKRDAPTGVGHDMKGTHGGTQGLCPVYVAAGSKATAKRQAKGVAITITPTEKTDELAKEIDRRIAKAADWTQANIKAGDQGNQGGVGGGKGKDGSNRTGKGDGKGRERNQDGKGGGKGTGGGGGAGTGGGGSKGTGGGAAAGSASSTGWNFPD